MTAIYERNYAKLVEILGDPATWPTFTTLSADGYMDLHFELRRREGDAIIVSLAHYYRQNGDPMSDPAMDLRVYPERRMVEALSYEQHGIGNGLRRRVYLDDGRFFPRVKTELNSFLATWLRNIRQQGHRRRVGELELTST